MAKGSIKFIYGKPALLCNDALVVADLHLGIEREFNYKGLRIGSMFSVVMRELLQLVEEEKPKRLVLLGDIKHTIVGEEQHDLFSLRELIGELAKRTEVIVVPGNHDAGISATDGATIAPVKGIAIGNIGLVHGHAWPEAELMTADYLITGHVHPCVEFVDSNGYSAIERAWIVADANKKRLLERYPGANESIKLIVMPAFNPLVGGVPINRNGGGNALGPLLRSGMFKLADGQIFLLNGIELGKASSLSRYGNR